MPTISELFDVFSANLALYEEGSNGRFMCPLCLRTFARDQIHTDLSRAHIIPQFLRGSEWTIACKACNNKVGSEIESCEADRADFSWALSGDSEETVRVQVVVRNEQGEIVGPVQADMGASRSAGDRRLQLYPKRKGSHPVAVEILNKLLHGESSAGSWTIEGHFRETRSIKRANLTYVHTAYLLMFQQFGYEWVLDPCATLIRKQVMSPDESIILPLAPRLTDHQLPGDELELLLVTDPADWRHFMVVLPLFRGWAQRQAVWIPLFGCAYAQPPQRKGVKLEVVHVPDHHRFLQRADSRRQGYRFVFNYFSYNAALHRSGCRCEEDG